MFCYVVWKLGPSGIPYALRKNRNQLSTTVYLQRDIFWASKNVITSPEELVNIMKTHGAVKNYARLNSLAVIPCGDHFIVRSTLGNSVVSLKFFVLRFDAEVLQSGLDHRQLKEILSALHPEANNCFHPYIAEFVEDGHRVRKFDFAKPSPENPLQTN